MAFSLVTSAWCRLAISAASFRCLSICSISAFGSPFAFSSRSDCLAVFRRSASPACWQPPKRNAFEFADGSRYVLYLKLVHGLIVVIQGLGLLLIRLLVSNEPTW